MFIFSSTDTLYIRPEARVLLEIKDRNFDFSSHDTTTQTSKKIDLCVNSSQSVSGSKSNQNMLHAAIRQTQKGILYNIPLIFREKILIL